MRLFWVFVPLVALLAQTRQAEPIPGQFPPVRIEPIPSPSAGAPLKRGGFASNFAVLVHKVEPRYTAEARAAGLQGTVSLYVEVNGDGTPSQVRVMEGLGLGLDEEAMKAVEQWEFQPRRGVPNDIQDALEVDVTFRLDQPGTWLVESERYGFAQPVRDKYGEIDRPALTHYVAPAVACREPRTVGTAFTIGKDGKPRVTTGSVETGFSEAIQAWRFTPTKAGGKALEALGSVEFACRPAAKSETAPAPDYRVGGGVAAPVLLQKTEPMYSELARRSKVQGTTMLYVQISPDGRPTQMHVVKRLGMGLDQKAMEAAKRWKFKPGMKDGKPVTVEATIEVNFRLK
jgi:TonB family protein